MSDCVDNIIPRNVLALFCTQDSVKETIHDNGHHTARTSTSVQFLTPSKMVEIESFNSGLS